MSADQFELLNGRLDIIEQKIESQNTVVIINGGGRHITFQRNEFFQMLYDKGKEGFNNLTDRAKRLNGVVELVWKVVSLLALIFAAIKIGA